MDSDESYAIVLWSKYIPIQYSLDCAWRNYKCNYRIHNVQRARSFIITLLGTGKKVKLQKGLHTFFSVNAALVVAYV